MLAYCPVQCKHSVMKAINTCILTNHARSSMIVSMNQLDTARRAQVIAALCEGNSIRSTVRMTSVSKNTVTKLLVELGVACTKYQDGAMRNLKCRRIQCDEIWSYVGAKDANIPE